METLLSPLEDALLCLLQLLILGFLEVECLDEDLVLLAVLLPLLLLLRVLLLLLALFDFKCVDWLLYPLLVLLLRSE